MAALVLVPMACGGDSEPLATAAPVVTTESASPSSTFVSASEEWQREGDRLIADKRRQAETGPYGTEIANWGDWAYRSDPIDVNGPGTYEMNVPVADSFNPPDAPSAFALNTPPDFVAEWQVLDNEVREVDGRRVLLLTIQIDGDDVTYPGLTFWVY